MLSNGNSRCRRAISLSVRSGAGVWHLPSGSRSSAIAPAPAAMLPVIGPPAPSEPASSRCRASCRCAGAPRPKKSLLARSQSVPARPAGAITAAGSASQPGRPMPAASAAGTHSSVGASAGAARPAQPPELSLNREPAARIMATAANTARWSPQRPKRPETARLTSGLRRAVSSRLTTADSLEPQRCQQQQRTGATVNRGADKPATRKDNSSRTSLYVSDQTSAVESERR